MPSRHNALNLSRHDALNVSHHDVLSLSHHDALNISGIGNRARLEPDDVANLGEASSPEDKAYNITRFLLDLMKKDSRFFKSNPSESLPKFEATEVTLEKNLGQGEFGVVFSISAIDVKADEKEEPKNDTHTNATHDESVFADDSLRTVTAGNPEDVASTVQIYLDRRMLGLKDAPPGLQQHDLDLLMEPNVSKSYMSKHVMRGGISRYAIKRLKMNLKGDMLLQATADLASEANFLMSLRHPNICRMRGTIGELGKPGFAIVMDRLTITLRTKMAEWKKLDSGSVVSKLKKALGAESQSRLEAMLVVQKELYGEKLLAAYDAARALRCLAEHFIVFRDLKPENLAFDLRGDLRLFDLGLAKELKEKDKQAEDQYRLTGITGSRRYMAPEVVMSKYYGLPVDVYSFAIMFWEMMSNRDAYASYFTPEKHREMVVTRKKRPNLKKMISKKVPPQGSTIYDVIEQSWSHDPKKRPSIEEVCDTLFSEIMSASNEESTKVAVDRSTHLAAGSLRSRLDEPLWC